MPRIQKAVPGLAKFLGSETQGLLQLEALTEVRPVVEIDDYLGPNKWTLSHVAALAPGGNIEIDVPEKRFWRVKFVSCYVNNPNAQRLRYSINLVKTFGGTSYKLPILPPVNQFGVAGQQYTVGDLSQAGAGMMTIGLNAEPGDKLQLDLDAPTGALNVGATLYVQYQELEL